MIASGDRLLEARKVSVCPEMIRKSQRLEARLCIVIDGGLSDAGG